MTGGDEDTSDVEQSSAAEKTPTRQDVLEEIERIRDQIKVYPGISDFEEHSIYELDDIYRHFEWYNNALKAAKNETGSPEQSAQSDKEENTIESSTETPPEPEPTSTTVESTVTESKVEDEEQVDSNVANDGNETPIDADSGPDALDHSTETARSWTPKEILEEIRRVRKRLNKRPTTVEFHQNSNCDSSTVYTYFDSWSEAVDAAINYKDPQTFSKQDSQATDERDSIDDSPLESDGERTVIARITDDGTPLEDAKITSPIAEIADGETDELGFFEFTLPNDIEKVSLEVTHTRSTTKEIDISSDKSSQPHSVKVSGSEWDTGESDSLAPPDTDEQGEEDETDEILETIFRDIEQLDEE